uniref:Uncharacterized protein n=1 Tax=Klebsiella pneumoniae TaxID=573 RepID=A0A8B0SS24_KLEPN|nr:hypothetical protein [Klebsiella pneumoniae]
MLNNTDVFYVPFILCCKMTYFFYHIQEVSQSLLLRFFCIPTLSRLLGNGLPHESASPLISNFSSGIVTDSSRHLFEMVWYSVGTR